MNLHNRYLHKDRNILIHSGGGIKDSLGCLLIGDKLDKDDKGNIVRITQGHTHGIASEFMAFLMQRDTKDSNTNKFRYLSAKNNNKIEIPNIDIVIRNEFGNVEKSKRVRAISKYIITALEYIDEFDNDLTKANSIFIPKNLRDLKRGNIFDKSKIIETLTARINNLKNGIPNPNLFPNQDNASLCGPAVFFYCLLIDRPDLYVKCVIDLWSDGFCIIKNENTPNAQGLTIKPSESCKNPTLLTYNDNIINGVDWITLASLRDSKNNLYAYDESDDEVAGITFAGEIKEWFEAVGSEISTKSNETYRLHIGKEELLDLVAYKSNNPKSHIISLINAEIIGGSDSGIPGIKKSHWAVWNTSPQSNGEAINNETPNNTLITQDVVSWGTINQKLNGNYTLQAYLDHQFGAIIASPIP